MKKKLISAILAITIAFGVSFTSYASAQKTVNDLPGCETYDLAVYRLIGEMYPGVPHGKTRLGKDFNIFVKVDNVLMEFTLQDGIVKCLGLQNSKQSEGLEDIGDEYTFGFETPIPSAPEENPAASTTEDLGIPELPGEWASEESSSEDDWLAESDDSADSDEELGFTAEQLNDPNSDGFVPMNPNTEFYIGSFSEGIDETKLTTQIVGFYEKATPEAQAKMASWFATGPIWSEVATVTSEKLTGRIQGVRFYYEIELYADGTIVLPTAAWTEYPHWAQYRRNN